MSLKREVSQAIEINDKLHRSFCNPVDPRVKVTASLFSNHNDKPSSQYDIEIELENINGIITIPLPLFRSIAAWVIRKGK